jgi:hypothetical protein
LAVDADTSLMGVDQLADDGEAEADPGGFAAQFTAATDEGFEDARVVGGRDARAAILDTDDGQAREGRCHRLGEGDVDRGGRRRMLQGVVDEVYQDLSEGLGIGMGFDRGIGQMDFQGDIAFLGSGLEGFDNGGDVLGQVEAGGFEFGTAAFEAGMAQDVVDEQTEAAGFAEDETVVFLAAWGVFGGQVDEFFGEQAHGGERGA